MAVRNSQAHWEGNLPKGNGTMKLGSGLFEGPFTFASRFENGKGTNPEELIGAAIAGCFSMFLAALLVGTLIFSAQAVPPRAQQVAPAQD